jgi:alpha-D-xyloside xylohydrolase
MALYTSPPFGKFGYVEGKRIVWEAEGDLLWLEPYGKNSLRFRSSKSLHVLEDLNWTLLPPQGDDAKIIVTDEKAVIKNGTIHAEVLGDGTVNYYDRNGKELLKESWQDMREEANWNIRKAREYETISSENFKIDLYFRSVNGEHIHGLGQDPNDIFELKGTDIRLEQRNTKVTIPFIVSSLGYGFLWNNPAIGSVEFAENHTHWHAKTAKQIDYIVMAGDSPMEIMKIYTGITGRAPILPRWAAGFWQCKLRYETQEQLLSVAREYKKRGIPLSVIVIDYFHWPKQGDWKFDPKYWPDPKAMVQELTKMNIRLMVSIWPTVDMRSENYLPMKNKNYLVRAERGASVFKFAYGTCTFVDSMHPGARKYFWDRVKENYYCYGIKTFWLDESEPSLTPYDYVNARYYSGNGLEVSALYPYYYAKTFYDGMKEAGEQNVLTLTRSAWLGSQRNSTVVWSGDIPSTFVTLRRQIKAGLNFSYSGIPWWTTDIGGFYGGDPKDPEFRELIARWFAFGVFSPIFRLHSHRLPYPPSDRNDHNAFVRSGADNEVWSFGKENYKILVDLIHLRERLVPYIMEQMEMASIEGIPVMRPLIFDYPDDEKAYSVSDVYLFGPDILVAPIIEYKARRRSVYLPKGASWLDPYSGKTWQGGETVEVEAPLDRIPLFLKNGASLPIIEKSHS